jgi:hypothetical protein
MKKYAITISIIFSFLFTDLLSVVKEVPKPTAEQQQNYKKRNWQPWVVAIITFLIAGTGIYYVAKHKGKKDPDRHNNNTNVGNPNSGSTQNTTKVMTENPKPSQPAVKAPEAPAAAPEVIEKK